jgi:hypothetical protein
MVSNNKEIHIVMSFFLFLFFQLIFKRKYENNRLPEKITYCFFFFKISIDMTIF